MDMNHSIDQNNENMSIMNTNTAWNSSLTSFHNMTQQLPQNNDSIFTPFEWTINMVAIVVLTFALLFILAFLGLGNLLTIHFTFHQRRLKRPFNLFFTTMAAGDFICSDFVTLLEIYDLAELIISDCGIHKMYGLWCTVKVALRCILLTFSITQLAMLSFLRMLYCCDKLPKEKGRLRRIILGTICGCLVFSVLFGHQGAWPSTYGMQTCMLHENDIATHDHADMGVTQALQVVVITVSLLLTIMSYISLAVAMRYRQSDSRTVTVAKHDMVTLKTLRAIICVFIASFGVPFIAHFVVDTQHNNTSKRIIRHLFRSLIYVQSSFNPIILYISNSSYREYVKLMFSRRILASEVPTTSTDNEAKTRQSSENFTRLGPPKILDKPHINNGSAIAKSGLDIERAGPLKEVVETDCKPAMFHNEKRDRNIALDQRHNIKTHMVFNETSDKSHNGLVEVQC